MDFIVDQYLPIVEALEEQLETLEEEIFGEHFNRETTERASIASNATCSPSSARCRRSSTSATG